MCNQIGHSRPEEGSEHYFCYCLEHVQQTEAEAAGVEQQYFTHAEFVGPGLLIMGTLQGIDVAPLKQAYRDAGLSYDFGGNLGLLERTLRALPEFCHEHTHLPYGVAHTLTTEQIDGINLAEVLS